MLPRNMPSKLRGEAEVLLYQYSTLALEGGGWSAPRPGRFSPREGDAVPIVQEVGWTSGPAWTGPENLASTGIRSPERPTRSKSLHRLRYPCP
jgi:hypothetical protein